MEGGRDGAEHQEEEDPDHHRELDHGLAGGPTVSIHWPLSIGIERWTANGQYVQ